MKTTPPEPPTPSPNDGNNNGEALPADLEALLAKAPPERRAAFLQLRQRLKRHDDNDELLAVIDHLDTSVVLMDLACRQAQPEAVAQTLAKVEAAVARVAETTARQTAVTDRINKRSQYLNLGWPLAAIVLSAALSLVGAAIWHDWIEKAEQARRDQMAQAYEQSDEGMWWHNLRATRAGLRSTLGDKDSNGVSRRLTLMVGPGKEPGSWKLASANLDAGGNAVLTFHTPEPGAAEAAAAAGRHR